MSQRAPDDGAQSRRMSLAESMFDSISGYVVSIGVQIVAFPYFGMRIALWEHMTLGLIFFVASVARKYLVRRLFEAIRVGGHKVKKWLIRFWYEIVLRRTLIWVNMAPFFVPCNEMLDYNTLVKLAQLWDLPDKSRVEVFQASGPDKEYVVKIWPIGQPMTGNNGLRNREGVFPVTGMGFMVTVPSADIPYPVPHL